MADYYMYLGFKSKDLEFAPALPRAFTIDQEIASILAQARAMGNKEGGKIIVGSEG